MYEVAVSHNTFSYHTMMTLQSINYFREKLGEESYLIPVGGSDSVGLFGYITVFQELQEQVCNILPKL